MDLHESNQASVEERIKQLQDENAVLRIQNEILVDSIKQANLMMSSVPLWNNASRELASLLSKIKKEMQ